MATNGGNEPEVFSWTSVACIAVAAAGCMWWSMGAAGRTAGASRAAAVGVAAGGLVLAALASLVDRSKSSSRALGTSLFAGAAGGAAIWALVEGSPSGRIYAFAACGGFLAGAALHGIHKGIERARTARPG